MSILLHLVWGTKVLLTSYNTYRLCFGDSVNPLICGASGFYLSVLVLATLFSIKGIPTREQITSQEPDLLRKVEEGLLTGNEKQD